jgi:hypothetical protein
MRAFARPGFPVHGSIQQPRVRLSLRKAAWSSSTPPTLTGNPGECTSMDAMCKAGFFATRIRPALDRALHSRQPLSTASCGLAVDTVGKAGPNSNIFTSLPAFHFAIVQFSKTGRAAIHASRLVSSLLSTFPVPTVTTTNKEYIFKAFHSSRDPCPPLVCVLDRESTGTTRLTFSCGFGVV